MSLLLALTVATEVVAETIANAGGARTQTKTRPRPSSFFIQQPIRPALPEIRRDDDEIPLLMIMGAL